MSLQHGLYLPTHAQTNYVFEQPPVFSQGQYVQGGGNGRQAMFQQKTHSLPGPGPYLAGRISRPTACRGHRIVAVGGHIFFQVRHRVDGVYPLAQIVAQET